jgi:hypothetical protein
MLSGHDRALERNLILGGAWPQYPMLPVKRDAPAPDWLEVGFIVWVYVGDEKDRPVKVYLANLTAVQLDSEGKTWQEAVAGIEETITYPSLDAFFDAGWRGD